MKRFKLYCILGFKGEIEVTADNIDDARQIVWDNFWATISDVSDGDNSNIKRWSFDHSVSQIDFGGYEEV